MTKLSAATSKKRSQLPLDGFYAYPPAARKLFRRHVHYAALVKNYAAREGSANKRLYCVDAILDLISGNPAREKISTTLVERVSLSIRNDMRQNGATNNRLQQNVGESGNHLLALDRMLQQVPVPCKHPRYAVH